MSNYYRVLGVSRYADLGEIRRAYWSLARRVHRESRRGACASDLTEIQRAYETLSDLARRQMYDARHAATLSTSAEGLYAVPDDVPAFDDDDVAKDFPSMATIARIVPQMRAAFFSAEAEVGENHTTRVELTPKEAHEGVRIPFIFRSDPSVQCVAAEESSGWSPAACAPGREPAACPINDTFRSRPAFATVCVSGFP